MSKLVVIDGNAILHRAYHALPPLTAPNGQLVNAVYGFATIVFKILEELKPDYLAVAFDRAEPTFRKKEYVGYQSKRKEMDLELVDQVGLVHQLVDSLGIAQFSVVGFEADDVIGTLTTKATEEGDKEAVVVTGDRDLMQLVNERVKLYMPQRGVGDAVIVGAEEVKERMGVGPELIVDYKALVGDSSDNYPGVVGIGPKTAVGLLEKYGSFEEIWKNLEKIENPGLKKKLVKGREGGELSKRLATIVTEVPVEVDWDNCKYQGFDKESVAQFFRQVGFRSLVKKVAGEEEKKEEKKKAKMDDNQGSLF